MNASVLCALIAAALASVTFAGSDYDRVVSASIGCATFAVLSALRELGRAGSESRLPRVFALVVALLVIADAAVRRLPAELS